MTLVQKVKSEMPKGENLRPETEKALKAVQEMHDIAAKVKGSAYQTYVAAHSNKK